MKFIRPIFFVVIVFSDSFCGTVFSKFKSKNSELSLSEKIKEKIKARENINKLYKVTKYYYTEFGSSRAVTEYFFILNLAVQKLDVESVKLLLENGACPNNQYIEKTFILDTLSWFTIEHANILNFVSLKLNYELSNEECEEREKYEQIQKLLVFAGTNKSYWNYPNEKLLREYHSLLKSEFIFGSLIAPLQNIVLEYLGCRVNNKS